MTYLQKPDSSNKILTRKEKQDAAKWSGSFQLISNLHVSILRLGPGHLMDKPIRGIFGSKHSSKDMYNSETEDEYEKYLKVKGQIWPFSAIKFVKYTILKKFCCNSCFNYAWK